MGAFYGSIHVRSQATAAVRRALEELASQGLARFLLAPASGGWISIYPWKHGQDSSVSAAIAARVPATILHVIVHDDDVFAYTLYDAGGPVDEYVSDPDYFEPSTEAERDRTKGRPEALAALVGREAVDDFTTVLDRGGEEDRPFRATWQLTRLAELLGLSNVETSYEYLRQGEVSGIKGWKQFVHLPDLAAEKAAKRRRAAEITATTKRLQHEGRLLLVKKSSTPKIGIASHPVFCSDPLGGFLLTYPVSAAGESARLEQWLPPWDQPRDTAIPIGPAPHGMMVSSSGRLLGIGDAAGGWSAEVVDLAERRVLASIDLPGSVDHISFTPDDRLMVCRSLNEVRMVSPTDGETVRSVRLEGGRGASLHPSGRWLVANVQQRYAVAIVDLDQGRVVGMLRTRPNDFAEFRRAHAEGRPVLAGFHPQEMPYDITFTSDGRMVALTVEQGVRLYSWEELLRAGGALPRPLASADTALVKGESGWWRHTYAVVHDSSRSLVLFCAFDGRVHCLHTESGRSGVVLEVPGTPPIVDLAVGGDGGSLAIVTSPGMLSRDAKQTPPVWQVWRLDTQTHE